MFHILDHLHSERQKENFPDTVKESIIPIGKGEKE